MSEVGKEHRQLILEEELIVQEALPPLVASKGFTQVVAELGVGSGRLLCALAQAHPSYFFVGVDLYYKPLNRTAKKLYRAHVQNAALVRFNVVQPALVFPDHYLEGVIVNFPDPWPKKKHARHRFFYGPVAGHLKKILKPGGWVFLQTDQEFYFKDAVELLTHAKFKIHLDAYPEIWVPEVKSGFQMLFERQGLPIYRVLGVY